MSYASSRISSTPSILKKLDKPERRSIVQSPKTLLTQSPRALQVKSPGGCNVRELLSAYSANGTHKNKEEYINLICQIRDTGINLSDDDLKHLLQDSVNCLPLFEENLELYVKVLLLIKWKDRSDEIARLYHNFVLDLCSAHNIYTKFALQQLVAAFLDGKDGEKDATFDGPLPSALEPCFVRIHEVIQGLLKMIPMSRTVLVASIKKMFPHFKNVSPICAFNYVRNILHIATYEAALKRDILDIVINRLVYLDAIVSYNEKHSNDTAMEVEETVFVMELDESRNNEFIQDDKKNLDAVKMDYCLHILFQFIHSECYDDNNRLLNSRMRKTYEDLLYLFEKSIMPTHGQFSQFLIFYIISFDDQLSETFLKYLWGKATGENEPSFLRQVAVCYLSGIVARANFISTKSLKNVLKMATHWLHNYSCMKTADPDPNVNVKIHGIFYSICQMTFYLIAFRHSELFLKKRDLKFVKRLNMAKIVTSDLQPFSVCSPSVTCHFARIMREYQVAYCDANYDLADGGDIAPGGESAEHFLGNYFPFDMYTLKRSECWITPLYRDYKEVMPESFSMEEDEDFLEPSPRTPIQGALSSSISSGFK